MFNKAKKKLGAIVGVTGDRDGKPPAYQAIAPGLIVTDTAAWAWYQVRSTNSDLLSEEGRDREQDRAEAALKPLTGRDCHLRTLWSEISGSDYLQGLDIDQAPEEVREWHAIRADRIDDLAIPARTILLGVRLADRATSAQRSTSSAFGVSETGVPDAELSDYAAQAAALGKKLHSSVWRARLASPEVLAWSIAREMHRGAPIPKPIHQSITGAPLHRLSGGRVVPFPDHLVFMAPDGTPAAYGSVIYLADIPETIETPGGEWLAVLNGLETSPIDTATDTGSIPVLAEADVRFRVMPRPEARELVNDARQSAKEQRQSAAKNSAGEPDEAILQTEAETVELGFELSRRHLLLVDTHPRIVVSAATKPELDAKVAAVLSEYDMMSIQGVIGADEQRELWLESLPCDRVRVPDMGHPMTSTAFVQSWFWGGSRAGTSNPRIPAVGYTTGSTQHTVRFLATEGADRQSAPVTVFTGITRRGKTTSIQLAVMDVMLAPSNIMREPLAYLIDVKGDIAGIKTACDEYGIPATFQQLGGDSSAGMVDAFVTSTAQHAVTNAVGQLALLLPPRLTDVGSQYLTMAAGHVAQQDDEPRNWKVIERLVVMSDQEPDNTVLRDIARTLQTKARTGWASLVAGRPRVSYRVPTQTGVHVLQVPGLGDALPLANKSPKEWDEPQREAVAALRGLLGMCTSMAMNPKFRQRPKVVAIPEVHVLTSTTDGQQFLGLQARMGAAFGVALLLDTQDVTGIYETGGLAEAIHAVFGFSQDTDEEQNALARLLRLAVDQNSRDVIATLDVAETRYDDDDDTTNVTLGSDSASTTDAHEDTGRYDEADPIRRGHCLYRDARGEVATMQWDLPSEHLMDLLDTSPHGAAARAATQQAHGDSEDGHHGDHEDNPMQEAKGA